MDEQERLACASYTHARRHPMVLGRIAGWTPPFQLTISQIAVLIISFLGLMWSWGLWARWLPGGLATMVVLAVPSSAAWAARRARVEGRSLPRAAVGFAQILSGPRQGVVGGRPFRATRTRWCGCRVLVEDPEQ